MENLQEFLTSIVDSTEINFVNNLLFENIYVICRFKNSNIRVAGKMCC